MYVRASKLIEDEKISYSDLDEMIQSGLIKNLFVITGVGEFKKIESLTHIEEDYYKYKESMLANATCMIADSKQFFMSICKKYKNEYSAVQSRLFNYEREEQKKRAAEHIKKMMEADKYRYDKAKESLRDARKSYKDNEKMIIGEKHNMIYSRVSFLEIEYDKAKKEYVKKFLKNQ